MPPVDAEILNVAANTVSLNHFPLLRHRSYHSSGNTVFARREQYGDAPASDRREVRHTEIRSLNLEALKNAVRGFAKANADNTGLARAPIAGLMMKHLDSPTGDFHALYPSMVCLILQGEKRLMVGSKTAALRAGETFIISNSVPATGAVVQATRNQPYIAIAVQIDAALLAELVAELDAPLSFQPAQDCHHCLSTATADGFLVDCLFRLVRLIDHPKTAALLRSSMMRELHCWLLSGQHGANLRTLVNASSRSGRLENAISLLQTEYASRLPANRLADAAGMSLTSFHKHFKQLTAMTPGQYQKKIRLLEARRLMLDAGLSVTAAAFRVGYESVSQFSRDYARMFELPPKREILIARNQSPALTENRPAVE